MTKRDVFRIDFVGNKTNILFLHTSHTFRTRPGKGDQSSAKLQWLLGRMIDPFVSPRTPSERGNFQNVPRQSAVLVGGVLRALFAVAEAPFGRLARLAHGVLQVHVGVRLANRVAVEHRFGRLATDQNALVRALPEVQGGCQTSQRTCGNVIRVRTNARVSLNP